jgi:hypothetical protein
MGIARYLQHWLSGQGVWLKKAANATPLNSLGFAVYSIERVRRCLQPLESP